MVTEKREISNEEVFTPIWLEKKSFQYPKRIAAIYLGKKYSYSKLNKLSDRFAAALAGLGIGNNDRVVLYIPNGIQWIISYFGIQRVGAVPVPISPTYTSYEVEYIAKDSGAKAIICQDLNFGYMKELSGTDIEKVIIVNIADTLPIWKRAIGFLLDRVPRGYAKEGENIYFFRKLIQKSPLKPPKVEINPGEHPAYLAYTGGTLGFPKGILSNYRTIAIIVKEYTEILKGYAKPEEEVFLLTAPFFHLLGRTVFIAFCLDFGCKTIIMPTPNIDAILAAVERYKVTILLGVPTFYRMILENDRFSLYNLSSLRICWSGGDVLPKDTFYEWHKKTGVKIRQIYGGTEAGNLSIGTFDRDYGPESSGRMVASRQHKIVNPDTLEELPEGEVGELLVYGEDMQKSYWKKPEETFNSFVNLDGRIWYRTGDQLRKEGDELFFVDRSADIIKYKGYRVSASEIETALKDHPAVMEACVTGVPDPVTGERIKGIVVMKEGVRGINAIELIKWCEGRMAPYKVPKYIEFRDMLPKSKVGKLLRREVRDEQRRQADPKKV